MSTNEKFAVALVAVVPFLLILITGLTQGWPTWSWLLLSLLSPAVSVLLARSIKRSRAQQFQEYRQMSAPPPPLPQPEQPRQEILPSVAVPSAVQDYQFLLSGTIYWRPKANGSPSAHGNLGAVAREAIISRSAEVLAHERPDNHSLLNERLNAVLGTVLPAPSGEVDAWASGISVTLPEVDLKRLHRLAEVRKEEEVWEHERNHERNVREYLGGDVLGNPGRAVVWWLARHTEQKDSGLEATVKNIDDLRRLTSAAHATEIPEWQNPDAQASTPSSASMPGNSFHPSGDDGTQQPFNFNGGTPEQTATEKLLAYFDETVRSSEPDERDLFVRRVAQVFDTHGQNADATELRRRFGVSSYVSEEPISEPVAGEADGVGDGSEADGQ